MIILVVALTIGAGFGALTSLANALSHSSAALESEEYSTSGWSVPEIVSLVLDSGWAWAGLAIVIGWLLTRENPGGRAALARGAVAGPVALVAAVAAYALVDTARSGAPLSDWIHSEQWWWLAAVVFGVPLGAVGACARRPGVVGLLAGLTLPVGAAVQMVLLPPGRNEVVRDIGQAVVWTAAALFAALLVLRTVRRTAPERRR
ncbi:hypothetical protein [Herbidospora sp. NBRC 101105]|uniref:hypothetical protein n=1 Tax=Herbidospora sp. NBRC 101105 TaxID=3032195 RepID=UPI002556259A|nr:hypothetical protein [Herbidospora sp. NBRC 101105]